MDGILIIDKPIGLTSHDVVARLRRILRTKKIGHTGTLDPFATGVLVALVGKATRLAQFLDKDEKEYEAAVSFGHATDTGDRTGTRISDADLPMPDAAAVAEVLPHFTGNIMQVPPMYSAKKVGGRKLYEIAREGGEIERAAVPVTVSELEALSLASDTRAMHLRIVCSAGTYVRTLAEDIARAAGSAAHLAELRRTRAGRFSLSGAVTIDELERSDDPYAKLLPMTAAVTHLPEMSLTADRAARTLNGLSSRFDGPPLADGSAVRMTGPTGELLAVGIYSAAEEIVQPKVVLR